MTTRTTTELSSGAAFAVLAPAGALIAAASVAHAASAHSLVALSVLAVVAFTIYATRGMTVVGRGAVVAVLPVLAVALLLVTTPMLAGMDTHVPVASTISAFAHDVSSPGDSQRLSNSDSPIRHFLDGPVMDAATRAHESFQASVGGAVESAGPGSAGGSMFDGQ
jgi:hypothetical protein